MKKHYVYYSGKAGNIILVIFSIFFMSFFATVLITTFALTYDGVASLPFYLGLILIVVVFVFIIGTSIRGSMIARKCLCEGFDSKGIIREFNYYRSRNGSGYHLVFQYRDEFGEEALIQTNVTHMMSVYFMVGKEIPIKVKGKYAFYDIEAIKNRAYPSMDDHNHPTDSKNYCTKCGAKLYPNDLYCSNCGARIEK